MAQDEAKPDAKPEAAENEQQQPQQPAKKSPIGKKLAILGVVLAIIGMECGAAYWLLNSATSAAAQSGESAEPKGESKSGEAGEHKPAKHEGKGEGKEGADGEKDPDEQVEVVLGEFSVTSFQPATNTTLRIEFNLYGTVDAKNQKEFLASLEENQHRFRDQVLVIVRSAEITDLTDAGLGLVKRKIMEKTNQMIGKPFLHTVIFSDFSFVEQ
jgi:flagellar basal body-associated protein FliL